MEYCIRVGKQKTGFEFETINVNGTIFFGGLEYALNEVRKLLDMKSIKTIEVFEGQTQKRIISVIIEGGIK